jgi:putative ABC transport system permease protein
MSDWREAIDRRLASIGVSPLRRVEIVEEVTAYLQDRYDEFRSAGYTSADARRLALADLETDALARELARTESRAPADMPPLGSRRSTFMATLWQDLTYAVRSLGKTPSFTIVVVVTLALGIGANTAVFSVADAVMLRPYSYPNMERIVSLNERARSGQQMSVAWPTYQDWRDQNQVFEHLGIYRGATVNLTGMDQAERLSGAVLSSAVFETMGIPALIGRAFTAEDDTPGAGRIAVISERLWRGRFDADAAVLGRSVLLNNEPHTIVGVMPAAMRFPSRLTDVWLPLGPIVDTLPTSRGSHPGLIAIGKLKAGVPFDRAVSDMDTIARRLEQQYPESNTNLAVEMTPYYEQIVQNIRPTLLVLLGAVGFVLLIACANLANLMLARSERRQREIAVRRALGADRRRIVQQLLTESLVMAILGGGIGVLLAYWIVQMFVASRPVTIPRIDLVGVDLRVLGFATLLSLATGVIYGLVPALRASNPDVVTALKQSGRGSILAPSVRLRSVLVVAQVALALMLLVGAGLMMRSFVRLMAIEPGFDPDNVVTMRTTLPAAKYKDREQWLAFHSDLIGRVATLPGITAAALNSALPLEGGGSESSLMVEGRPVPPPGAPPTMTLFQASSPDYHRAMGIQLLRGRYFTAQDSEAASRVVIVDETLVSKLFPNEEPLRKRISFETRGTRENPDPLWREIVGVVRHVRHYGLTTGPSYVQVYTPLMQLPIWFEQRRPSMALVARTSLAPEAVVGSIRRELNAIDRDIPLYGVQLMSTYLSQNTEQPRLSVALLIGFSALALTLAVVGIYGVVSYSVAQRTQEIGVRMALGASGRDVMRLVVGRAAILVISGVALGVAGALGLSSLIRTMLYQVSERDPATFAAIVVILASVGVLASVMPARRATRVDPIVALRES